MRLGGNQVIVSSEVYECWISNLTQSSVQTLASAYWQTIFWVFFNAINCAVKLDRCKVPPEPSRKPDGFSSKILSGKKRRNLSSIFIELNNTAAKPSSTAASIIPRFITSGQGSERNNQLAQAVQVSTKQPWLTTPGHGSERNYQLSWNSDFEAGGISNNPAPKYNESLFYVSTMKFDSRQINRCQLPLQYDEFLTIVHCHLVDHENSSHDKNYGEDCSDLRYQQ